jgi:hypothetical protein
MLTIERAQALCDRVMQRRLRLIDRYNGISIPGIRHSNPSPKATDGKVCPGDPPSIQVLFRLGKMLEESEQISDPYNRLNVQSGIMKQLASICGTHDEQNSKVVSELQEYIKMERNKGELTDEQLAKLAESA